MAIVFLVARILLGLMFTVLGLNGFLHFLPTPHLDPLVAEFFTVLSQSHYYVFIFAVQLIAGLLLLTGQFVPLALVLLGAVLANIWTFHITMQPAGFPMPLLATVLWVIVAWPLRATFAPIFARRPLPERSSR